MNVNPSYINYHKAKKKKICISSSSLKKILKGL